MFIVWSFMKPRLELPPSNQFRDELTSVCSKVSTQPGEVKLCPRTTLSPKFRFNLIFPKLSLSSSTREGVCLDESFLNSNIDNKIADDRLSIVTFFSKMTTYFFSTRLQPVLVGLLWPSPDSSGLILPSSDPRSAC